jgi:UTP--glucose-1-phosphate uridylyltransferase
MASPTSTRRPPSSAPSDYGPGALADVRIAAWLAAQQVPFALEAVRGTPADRKGGHLARYRGRVVLRETAQVPGGDTSFTDVGRWRWYNTNNIWIDLRALKDLQAADPAAPALPLIVNRETVDPRDPASTPVIQLEWAMGAAIGSVRGARAVHVPRSRFAPVKTTDDLLVVRSDAYELTGDGQMRPGFDGPAPVVTLDKDFYKLLPDFEHRFAGRGAVAAPLPPVRGRRRRHLRRGRHGRGRRACDRSASRSGRRGARRLKPEPRIRNRSVRRRCAPAALRHAPQHADRRRLTPR